MIDKMSKYSIETSSTTSSSMILSNLSLKSKSNLSMDRLCNSLNLKFLDGAYVYSFKQKQLRDAHRKLNKLSEEGLIEAVRGSDELIADQEDYILTDELKNLDLFNKMNKFIRKMEMDIHKICFEKNILYGKGIELTKG